METYELPYRKRPVNQQADSTVRFEQVMIPQKIQDVKTTCMADSEV